MKATLALSLLSVLALGAPAAFGVTTFIVEGGPNGQNRDYYLDKGWADSSGGVFADGCTSTGTRYSSTSSLFGPSRYAEATYVPTTAGFYEIDLVWTSTAGQSHTAVNLYTGGATNGPADLWGNPNGPAGVIGSGTINEYYSNARSWLQFTVAPLAAGTPYHVGVYGGYQTPYAGGATPADPLANRVTLGGVRFIAATPGPVSYGWPNHLTGLGTVLGDRVTGLTLKWSASQYASSYDVWLGSSPDTLGQIATGLTGTSLLLDDQNLKGLTHYFYRVDGDNVDVTTAGAVFDFYTIPEPSPALLALGGGLGLGWWAKQRRAEA